MKKSNLASLLVSIILLASCHSTDFSNPEDVIKSYRTYRTENKNDILYDEYLSAKSKEFVTKDEYIKTLNRPDTVVKKEKRLESKISSFPLDVNNPSYRRFKVEESWVNKTDTDFVLAYYTLINENGKWKIIWWQTLNSFAREKYFKGNYSEARKTFEKIIDLDPFCGEAYAQLSFCYYSDKSLTKNEWENGVVKNAKYAMSLEEENPQIYTTLATCYINSNNDLAIQTYERGLKYCKNKDDKKYFYSNLASACIGQGEYKKAESYITKSIAIDKDDCFAWYTYGKLMCAQNNLSLATKYFQEALSKPEMENAIQDDLYYLYALCCFKNGDCMNAKEYIDKALDLEPNSSEYQQLYNSMKDCK